jgi:hypothetical protein
VFDFLLGFLARNKNIEIASKPREMFVDLIAKPVHP